MNEKLDKLNSILDCLVTEHAAVAFSGGVDSGLLLAMVCDKAKKTGVQVYAVTVMTKLHPAADLAVSQQAAKEAGAEHVILHIDELEQTGILYNPTDRCYLCKKGIFTEIQRFADSHGVKAVIEGTNEDDLHVYRPGIRALKELGISSPLAEAGFTKKEVRELAKKLGISAAERPSGPCLATRLPYGAKLDYEVLGRLDKGESWLREKGFYNVRLRLHKEVLRIEVDLTDLERLLQIREETVVKMKALGFGYVTVDLQGFRSGSMDEGQKAVTKL